MYFFKLSLFVKPPKPELNILSKSIIFEGIKSNGNFFLKKLVFKKKFKKLKPKFLITSSSFLSNSFEIKTKTPLNEFYLNLKVNISFLKFKDFKIITKNSLLLSFSLFFALLDSKEVSAIVANGANL